MENGYANPAFGTRVEKPYFAVMFTGIIEATGIVKEVIPSGSNLIFWIQSGLSAGFRIDQSVSHSGVCLTVEAVKEDSHRVTAVKETLAKTTLGNWKGGYLVNLEQSLLVNSRLDGHWVQGHTDTTGTCIRMIEREGSREFEFTYPAKFSPLLTEKGSISLDGVSLTVFKVKKKSFRVAVIPYTFEHTSIRNLREGDKVNLEFDILGKYVAAHLKKNK
jgi:riboflavin synthase